jgi:hypothetical protein
MRTLLTVALAAGVVALAGCQSHERASARVGAGDPLARPLQLPKVPSGAACPRTQSHLVNPAFGPALGEGPAYAVMGARARLDFIYPAVEGQEWYPSEWSGQKVLWVVNPRYDGPVLIRGRRLDAPGRLGFGGDSAPAWTMRIGGHESGNPSGGWRNFPSYTRLKDNGCYAYQVDGRNFSYSIVFLARRQSL